MRSCLAAQTPLSSITQPGPAETCSQRRVFLPAAALFVPDSREKHLAAPPGVTSGSEDGPAHPGQRSRGCHPAPGTDSSASIHTVAARQRNSTWDRGSYSTPGVHRTGRGWLLLLLSPTLHKSLQSSNLQTPVSCCGIPPSPLFVLRASPSTCR